MLNVVVTSYCRHEYLKRTLRSLYQDPVRVFVADGGSDENTLNLIRETADGWVFFRGNPGADWLKTEGAKRFGRVGGSETVVISSDDLVYPKGYAGLIEAQFNDINGGNLNGFWQFVACSMTHWRDSHGITQEDDRHWHQVNGVWVMPIDDSQVSGAIISNDVLESVGYFANYGRSGQGDFTINRRLRAKGYERGYWRYPMIEHIGQTKMTDYPEYSKAFRVDEDRWQQDAKQDTGRVIVPDDRAPFEVFG